MYRLPEARRRRAALLFLAWLWMPSSAGAQARTEQSPPVSFTFGTAMRYAQERYPAVRAALEQVNVAQADVDLARTARLPRLDAMWQTSRATANNVFGQVLPQSVLPAMSGPVLASAAADSVWGSAVGGLLTWEPVDLGLRSATVGQADAQLVRSRANETLTRLAAQAAVGAAFLDMAGAEHALTAAEADVQRRDVLALVAHTLADNQLRPGADASRADAERAAAQTRLIRARQAVSVARALLARTLGVPVGTLTIDAAALFATPPETPTDATPPLEHPAVRASQAALDLSRARETTLQKTDKPRLLVQSALFARGTGASPDGRFDTGVSGLAPERANWAAGIQILFPNLFDAASLRARRAGAAAGSRADDARREETVLAVTAEQQTADAMSAAALAIAQNVPIQLAAARQSERQARARYDAGLASIVEVAESQSLLAAAEYQQAAAQVDVWRALLAQAVARGNVATLVERADRAGVR
jgi:outer membrane protein TolC